MRILFFITFIIIFSTTTYSIDRPIETMPSYNYLQKMSINSVLNVDSVLKQVNDYYNKSLSENDTLSQIETLLTLSDVHRVNENYSEAFDFGGQALYLAEQYQDTFILSEAYNKYGILNYLFYQKEDAIKYLKKSVQLSKTLSHSNNSNLRSRYFNLVLANRQFEDYNSALTYLDSCYAIGKSNTPYIDSEKGIILLKQKKFKESISVLKSAIKQFESINDEKDLVNSKGYLLVVYAYLAEAYEESGQDTLALEYYNKALSSLDNNKRYMSHKASILERYGWLEYKVGRYKEACEKLQEAYSLNEKHFSTKTISNTDFITTRDKFQESILEKNKEIAQQNLIISNHEKKILKVKIFLYSGALTLLMILLIIYSRYKIKKQRNTIINIEKEQTEANLLLEQKNKELTGSTLKLIEKDEMVSILSEHLKSLPKDKETDLLLKSISHQSKSLWDDFNSRFIAVNEGFYESLNLKFPELSPGDLKICALIKLNFSGKEMAHLLGISINSVNKARYRLRKKMKLDREVNLTTYISSI